jgi:hypothetical protein
LIGLLGARRAPIETGLTDLQLGQRQWGGAGAASMIRVHWRQRT